MTAKDIDARDALDGFLDAIAKDAAPEARLALYEALAVRCIEAVGELAREEAGDPQRIAGALDRIDFALGQSVRVLHSD